VSLSGMVGGKWSPTRPTTWRPYVEDLSGRRVTPHVTVNGHPTKTGKRRRTAIDGRTTSAAKRIGRRSRGPSRQRSPRCWSLSAGHLGTEWVDAAFTLATAAYNVVRLPKLLAGGAP
jgi:hypothetical protein